MLKLSRKQAPINNKDMLTGSFAHSSGGIMDRAFRKGCGRFCPGLAQGDPACGSEAFITEETGMFLPQRRRS